MLDSVQIMDVGDPVTVGFEVTRSLTPVGEPVPGLVQTTTLQNAAESLTVAVYSVKVPLATQISEGQAVTVVSCLMEPDLVGKVLYLDKVTQNGAAMLRKATATDFSIVDQQGKGDLS